MIGQAPVDHTNLEWVANIEVGHMRHQAGAGMRENVAVKHPVTWVVGTHLDGELFTGPNLQGVYPPR